MDKDIEELIKIRKPIHPKCKGQGFSDEEKKFQTSAICERIEPCDFEDEEGLLENCRCTVYVDPSYWWRVGFCPVASHYKPQDFIGKDKQRVGQQKQKKKK